MILKGLGLIALGLLLAQAVAVSDVTTTNCPTDYDIQVLNTTDSSFSQSTINLIYGGVYSSVDQAVLVAAFTEGDTETVNNYFTS